MNGKKLHDELPWRISVGPAGLDCDPLIMSFKSGFPAFTQNCMCLYQFKLLQIKSKILHWFT